MKKFISLFVTFIMIVCASVCTVSAEGVELTISGNKTVLVPGEILTLNMTYPNGEERFSQENEPFGVGRIRMVIDDGEPNLIQTKSGVTTYTGNYKASDFGVGTHTIWIYSCSTYVKRYDPNGVSFKFTVVPATEEKYLTQNFEGNTFTYDESKYTVTDSSGVMIEAYPDRYAESATDYLDTYYKVLDATGNGADGKALFGYNANAAADKSTNYKYEHYGKVTYDTNSLPNKGIIRLSMRYAFPTEYYADGYTDNPLIFMPFVLKDNLGNELITSRLGDTSTPTYYLGGIGFFASNGGGHGLGKKTSAYGQWYTLDVIYDCDTGLASMLWDGVILGANLDIGRLEGTSIETVTTVTSYRQGIISGLAVDDISITAYTASEAPEADPVFEIGAVNLNKSESGATLNISYTNTTDSDEAYVAFVALYDGNKLVEVEKFEDSFAASNESAVKTHTLETSETYTAAKGIVLESTSSLKPLIKCAE